MSLTAEDLQAISDLMDKKLEPINNRLDKMDERLDNIENRLEVIEEDVEIIKGASEEVLEWFSTYQRGDKDKPFPAREADIRMKVNLEKELFN